MEISEFPLLKERKAFAISNANKLTKDEINTVTDGSLSRIVFIKTASAEIVVREMDYVPEIDYLKLKKYDISDFKIENRDKNFAGSIFTKKWDGTVLSSRKYEAGKLAKTGKRIVTPIQNLKSNEPLPTATNAENPCQQVEICTYVTYCEQVHIGDEWVFTGVCTPWENAGDCYFEEYCGPDQCDYNSSESCQCQLYGTGCTGEGDGNGDDPSPPPTNTDTISPCDNVDSLAKKY